MLSDARRGGHRGGRVAAEACSIVATARPAWRFATAEWLAGTMIVAP